MSESDTIRIIKKYPNRRVYDTQQSQYIKMDDLRDMVIDGIEFQVIDTQSKADVTRSVLLQIILEQESEKNPLFTENNLKQFIRYSNFQHSQLFSAYLEQSLNLFNQQQEHFSDLFKQNSIDNLNPFSQKNVALWQNLQQQFFASFSSTHDANDTQNKE